jgi:hypothetical protein
MDFFLQGLLVHCIHNILFNYPLLEKSKEYAILACGMVWA